MNAAVKQAGTLPMETPRGDVVRADASSIMEVISRIASDPNVDVDKLERLFAMQERMAAQQAKRSYQTSLAEMQPSLPAIDENGAIKNNAGGVQSTYALWEDINDAVRPTLAEHGFALSFKVKNVQGGIEVTCILSHRDGHAEDATLSLQADTSGSKNAVQALGSSTSYAKRYTAMGLLNITSRAKQDRDDDGQAGGARQQSAAVSAAITAINLCTGLADLKTWKVKNEAVLPDLPEADQQAILRVFNTRYRKLKGETDAA